MSQTVSKSLLWSAEHRSFWLRKLHSLTGAVPLGAFLMLHLWSQARAMQGRQAYDEMLAGSYQTPFFLWVEIVLIYLPLGFHAVYGIKLGFDGRSNVAKYPYAKNWAYLMQRVTGIVAFAFIAFHLWQYRIRAALGELQSEDYFQELCATMSSTTPQGIPVMALGYLLGIAACAFHFANGLSGFCFSWGITTSARAQKRWAGLFGLVGLVLFAIGATTVIYFATGTVLWSSVTEPASGSLSVTCSALTPTAELPADPTIAPVAP